MRPTDVVKLEVKVGSTWVDYSEGIIDIGIIRGVQGYQYIWQQPESGILTLISRNPNLDPYNDENIRSGRQIRVKTDTSNIFTGRISEINVDYQPKGKPPQITLVAVDMVGTMALHTLSDGFTERLGDVMDIYGMFQELVMTNTTEIIGFTNPLRQGSPIWIASASEVTPSGSTALSVATTLSAAQIQFFYADTNNDMYLYTRMNQKKDEPIKLQFDSRGGATSYREIELTDNFDVLTNQLSIKNQGFNNNVIPLYTNQYSVSEWGPSRKEFTMQSSGIPAQQIDITDEIRDVIFADAVHPSKEIYYITWNGMLDVDAASDIDILDNVFIYHELDPEDIARKYGIIGIEHRITADDWNIKYYVKNHFVYDTNFPQPLIATDHPLGGTINDDITFTITNLDDIDTASATYAWKYAAGTTGNVVGSTFSTAQSPTINYALANVGMKYITCTVTDSYGFIKTSAPLQIQIFGAAPTPVTTSYTINPNDTAIYTFTATTTEATSYTFHWGDGTTYTTTNNIATHRYETQGTKSVYVVANNTFGSTQSATTTINVQFLQFPTAEVGTFPLRYIAITHPAQNLAGPGTVYPVFGRLQLNTSNAPLGSPTTDPQVNRALIGSWQENQQKEPNSTSPLGIQTYVTGNPQKINVQTGQTVTQDWVYYSMPTSGTFHTSTIFDMGAPFYDIKDIRLTFKNISTTGYASATWNVWITDNIEETFNFNTSRWWKIGTLNSGSIAPNGTSQVSITPLSYISLPLDAEPFPIFTYTVGNSADNVTGDKYTFSTDDFLTSAYLWNFGDGTTSTLQNPVKIYNSSGTRTVTLTKYDEYGNSESSSQTFTVNRVADNIGTFPVRYIKLKQNQFTSTGTTFSSQFFSPMLGAFKAKTSATNLDRLFNRPCITYTQSPSSVPLLWFDEGGSGVDDTQVIPSSSSPFLGTIAPDGVSGSYNIYPTNAITVGISNSTGGWNAAGIYPRRETIAGTGITEWEMIFDLQTPRYDISSLSLAFNRGNSTNLTSTSAKPSYEVYFSSNGTTWTKVANITVGSMPNSGPNGWYTSNASLTTGLPLNL
jgi:PKD repeat protein